MRVVSTLNSYKTTRRLVEEWDDQSCDVAKKKNKEEIAGDSGSPKMHLTKIKGIHARVPEMFLELLRLSGSSTTTNISVEKSNAAE